MERGNAPAGPTNPYAKSRCYAGSFGRDRLHCTRFVDSRRLDCFTWNNCVGRGARDLGCPKYRTKTGSPSPVGCCSPSSSLRTLM